MIFAFSHAQRTMVVREAARAIPVPAGPDQVARAAGLARGSFVVGALPFSPAVPATLFEPAHVERSLPASAVSGNPSALRITAVPSAEAYVHAVEKARAAIRNGDYDKVVLARMLVAQADHEFDRAALLNRLRAAEPDAYLFAVQGFIGATPELLVSRMGTTVRAEPLAGTAARAPGAAQRLLASDKERHEHALVVDAVRAALSPVCAELTVRGPRTIMTSKLVHLATSVQGTLREPAPSALDLAARLHPTPAVCGTPTEDAARAIAQLEEIDRGLYAGLVGWMDEGGDGEWAIALRCAEVAGRISLLFAGAGIVGDSDPQAELAETNVKFRSMLEALGCA